MMNPAESLTGSRQAEINIVGWVFTGFAIIVVALKLYARTQVIKAPGWDDFFIFLSLAFSIIAAALVSYSVRLGLGRHTAVVSAENGAEGLVLAAFWQIMGYPFNILAFSFPNISIAVLIDRLLSLDRTRKILLYAMVVLQVVFAMISIILVFSMCTSPRKLWNTEVTGTCWDENVLNYYSYWLSSYTTITDIVLAVIPISVFWKLQMRQSTKLGVCIMMGLTMLSAIVTIVKATFLHLFTDRTDPLFNVVPLVLWGLVEQNVVIIAACIPTLKLFFHRAFKTQNSAESHFGSGIQLSNTPLDRTNNQHESTSHVATDKRALKKYEELNSSQQGIWKTFDVAVDSDEELGKAV